MDKIRVLLFAMTGFGNNAFKVLARNRRLSLIGVVTPPRSAGSFPYYKCVALQDLVLKNKVKLYQGLKLREKKSFLLIKELAPDLIILSTFNQIIPEDIIAIPRLGVINVHPSLLPKYRGATPTVWVLMNGEKETGVSVHYVENEKIDAGRIIAQAKLRISPNDTDGMLRFKLAKLLEKVLSNALKLVSSKNKLSFPVQNELRATYFPKRTTEDGEIDLNKPVRDIINKVRAMSPYPGAYLKYNGKNYAIKSVTRLYPKVRNSVSKINRGGLVINISDGMIKFELIESRAEGC